MYFKHENEDFFYCRVIFNALVNTRALWHRGRYEAGRESARQSVLCLMCGSVWSSLISVRTLPGSRQTGCSHQNPRDRWCCGWYRALKLWRHPWQFHPSLPVSGLSDLQSLSLGFTPLLTHFLCIGHKMSGSSAARDGWIKYKGLMCPAPTYDSSLRLFLHPFCCRIEFSL